MVDNAERMWIIHPIYSVVGGMYNEQLQVLFGEKYEYGMNKILYL